MHRIGRYNEPKNTVASPKDFKALKTAASGSHIR